ncbi:growth factor receptor-bound protein 7-like isoform X2 [Syngnathus typhle]|uniref:growth factor receptor-bound protein 7-like isoform X2 n=1 Tax=Syngnathus typhle TaxID=161592 RepID=UPI002A6AA351|nr:growth factor receptor-bound protein 7-like isoform X2 [Syngnathus typhle]
MWQKESLGDDVTRLEVRRSQPISIATRTSVNSRSDGSQGFSSSAPCVPNPFPELCGPSGSPVATVGDKDRRQRRRSFQASERSPQSPNWSQLSDGNPLKVFGEDEHGRWLLVSAGATAMDVCIMLAGCGERANLALTEVHPALGFERCLEDHEAVLEVQAGWAVKADARLVFCKNYAKYEFFRKPALFFPDAMIADGGGKAVTSRQPDLVRQGSCPDICGFLHVKVCGRKSWKRAHFLLRRSGLYRSSKDTSKEPRQLHYVADLGHLHVYNVVNARNVYGAPQDFCFALAPSGSPVRLQHVKMLCADSEQTRTCWTSALRLFKYGKQLQCNFQQSKWARQSLDGTKLTDGRVSERARTHVHTHTHTRAHTQMKKTLQAKSQASLVGRDSSASSADRVLETPSEADFVERQEQQAFWRGEAMHRSLPDLNWAPLHAGLPWFGGAVTRKGAQTVMEKQGLVDGTFLIRGSRQHARCFVLSLCFQLKTEHFLVIPVVRGRRAAVSDDGRRRDSVHGPDAAGGFPPDQQRHPASLPQAPVHTLNCPALPRPAPSPNRWPDGRFCGATSRVT